MKRHDPVAKLLAPLPAQSTRPASRTNANETGLRPGALKAWLRKEHGIVVRVLPVATMPNWRRRYDRHSQRLFLSERLSPFDQLREVAMEACLIRCQVALAAEIQARCDIDHITLPDYLSDFVETHT